MRASVAMALLGLTAAACVETYQPQPPVQTGDDDGTDTSTTPDPGMMTPVEGVVECDPVQNAGCDFTEGKSCVWTTPEDSALCRDLSARLAHEAPCTPLTNACDRGMTCTALPQDHESTCYHVCDPDTGTGCENLPGTSPNYMCVRLFGLSFGVCVGTGIRCDPNEDPCGDEEVCSIRGGEAVCLPAGAANVGESCAEEACAKGGVCVNLSDLDEPRCFLPCDTEVGICPEASQVCTGLDGQRFGICQKTEAACSPLEDDCAGGQTCSLVGTDPTCVDAGSAALGEDCSEAACAPGGVCARMLSEDVPRCYEPCDLGFPTCSNPGTGCSDIGLEFGVCI